MPGTPLIQPVTRDADLLEDIAHARTEPEQLHVWWLGQSGFLLQWQGHHVLFDPYLSDSLTVKYADTDKPHVRMTDLVVDPGQLENIEVVTSSHNHTDHLDRETLLALRKSNPDMKLVIPEANRDFVAERLNCSADWPLGLEAGQSVVPVDGVRLHGIPAAHNELETDEQGRHKFMGYVAELGPWKVYHSGDTLHYDGMEEWLKKWEVDVAFLPINGNVPSRRVAGNLDGFEAAKLARDIGAKMVIPCHFEMFAFNTVSPVIFDQACRKLEQPYRVMRCGERWTVRR
jgi:L-ascorbate metabolism protein UlaG (beta-lactamase superfamily)